MRAFIIAPAIAQQLKHEHIITSYNEL